MLAVAPDNFRAHLRWLKERFPIVRFDENWQPVQKPAVALTFDDGYADNALEALPILEEVGVPATFFVSTGTIGTEKEFWWHEAERILLGEHSLPISFTLDGSGFKRRWLTGNAQERHLAYQEFVQLLNGADTGHRSDWLGQLRRWSRSYGTSIDRHRVMSVEELRLLACSSCATIGAHTVTHTRLSCLPPQAQREEISASKRQLEQWIGREITTFSYPFGRRSDYNRQSIAICREAGFARAAANFPGQAHRWTDPFQIPRHLVRNWPVGVFAEKLRGFWTR
jgi:peptidoglycan/xylan/chitin deacetylase (PgdA/CDA1 family)